MNKVAKLVIMGCALAVSTAAMSQSVTITNAAVELSASKMDIRSIKYAEATETWTITLSSNTRGQKFVVGGSEFAAQSMRFATVVTIPSADVQAAFGASYEHVKFAATTSRYIPEGEVKATFLALAIARMK